MNIGHENKRSSSLLSPQRTTKGCERSSDFMLKLPPFGSPDNYRDGVDFYLSGTKSSTMEFMQYLFPVGGGPSSKM